MHSRTGIDDPHGIRRGAHISRCGHYRYSLTREWGSGKTVLFVGLNPSTANHMADDPTVQRCMGFARTWGFCRLILDNLFAVRATRPAVLAMLSDPVGPENDATIRSLVPSARLVIAAWGNGGGLHDRNRAVLNMLPQVHCLGVTRTGAPRHPLYLPAATRPRLYAIQ